MNRLHSAYLGCVNKKMTEFLQDKEGTSEVRKETEWCLEEKRAYFNYMKGNLRTEYDNILRLEGNNY